RELSRLIHGHSPTIILLYFRLVPCSNAPLHYHFMTFRSLLFSSLLGCALTARGAGVVINEIMYHPSSENLLESFVEIYNTDAAATNLSGCQLTKGLEFVFPTNTVLGAGGYLVIAADRATFTNKYPGVINLLP